jgi:uncharacterized LabA/DUF88 family protein
MDRVAVFVDAGYVFAQGSVLLAGKKLPRSETMLDHQAAARAFSSFAEKLTGVPLLRIYWYDGTSTGPTAQHLTLAHLDSVKVRLGFVNSVGEQKGVDSLIVTDMIALARNRAISDAVLVTGDEDLRVGVQQAQEFGVRVHLVGIKPSRGSQSLFLLQEADTTHEWASAEMSSLLTCRPKVVLAPSPAPPPTIVVPADGPASTTDPLELLAAKVARGLDKAELEALVESFESAGQLPRDIDRQLLAGGRSAIERDLEPAEKRRVRGTFVELCRRRLVE